MSIRTFKYLSPCLVYIGAVTSFLAQGFPIWIPLIYAWIIIPVLELFIKPDASNLSATEEEIAKQNKLYDYLLYLIVPLQLFALGLFLYSVTYVQQPLIDIAGKTAVMGLLCGTFGINVGHELGHRVNKAEQFFAKLLLLSSLYMHFFIEHNRGHHKRVATPEDPSSARYGETVYAFYFRSIVFSYLSAWKIANNETRKKGYQPFSVKNEMIQFHLIQIAFVATIFFAFGWLTAVLFLAAAIQGILLLETVNYIEHYGLQRSEVGDGRWERTMPEHSWNSNHIIGRVMLFELSRHSDHHYLASRKYQLLRHHNNSPQMPAGYPGMMILSLLPPAWFLIMNRRIKELQQEAAFLPVALN
ncbi:MAG: fatty acid desaturase [Flavisolibacter sp.]|jgi:alkane 1-monooxygenase|nr:fatty acid desaturase [Flavisolibacter sp.]